MKILMILIFLPPSPSSTKIGTRFKEKNFIFYLEPQDILITKKKLLNILLFPFIRSKELFDVLGYEKWYVLLIQASLSLK